jgi:hypothetical protein
VQFALGRHSPDWRLRHACPACTYKLKDENHLIFSLLFTMDGNDSLKRILRRLLGEDDTPGPSSEYFDSRTVDDDFYLTREYVNEWANEAFEDLMATTGQVCFRCRKTSLQRADLKSQDNDDYNPCADRWKNMKEDITRKMWGIFDETGIFLALCRHGFSLVIADMVRSGEL